MTELTLFEADPIELPTVEPASKVSPDARRTIRQREAIERGYHPLGLAVGAIRLHPDAAKVVHKDDAAQGLRCGDCEFRRRFTHHNRTYAKCVYGGPRVAEGVDVYTGSYPRMSHGPGTDVRAWWPACLAFEARRV